MASSAHSVAVPDTAGRREKGDLFDSLAVWLVIALLVVTLLGSIVGLMLIYYGDSFAVPSWDERSVPAATTH
jgi:hypothetical protein